MTEIDEVLKSSKVKFVILNKIRSGITANTYLAKYKKDKSIIKVFKKQNQKNKLITNQFLINSIQDQMVVKKLFPEITYFNKKEGVLIYKYFEEKNIKLRRNKLIELVGISLSNLHSIKPNKNIKTFEDQLSAYNKILISNKKNKYVEEINYLFKKIESYEKGEKIFSHNDLNTTNILCSGKDMCFIDFEYSGMNSRFCDISRVVESFNLKGQEINILIRSYGIKNDSTVIDSINDWRLMNSYLDLIWAYVVNKIHKGSIKDNFISNLELKLDNKGNK